jgi:hypothetical protein
LRNFDRKLLLTPVTRRAIVHFASDSVEKQGRRVQVGEYRNLCDESDCRKWNAIRHSVSAEKQVQSETVYEVRMRMDNGSVRTLTQKTAPTPGSRVTVEGNTLHTMRAQPGDAQPVRTASGA